MYWRYFMWNFVGRYSDDDMEGQTNMNGIGGNWTSGLFNNTSNTPKFVLNNVTYTPLYALPLIVGLLGMLYHFQKRRKDALVITLLFFFTGLAIVLYVNQPSVQPRERDYSYVGSFYAFAIWIGVGLIALIDLVPKKINPRFATIGAFVLCTIVCPILLASKEWKNHDRSTKMAAHDMAYNYLMSCPKNAILFDLGDNDTYSLWYDQEVENIRPDVRIVNLSLLSADWSVRQMQRKINEADALPITMNFDKYKLGTRDVIRYNDAKIPGYVDVKDIFDFITSDDKRTHVEYTNGTTENYLPTKNFKLAVNAADVMKNKVITPEQKGLLTDTMKWKFPPNYITKENLAMIDILAHNDWKRPICFTTSIGQTSMVGLQPYLYQEGFTYRLLPFKTDSSLADQLSKTNSLVMYSNMMTKFKFGNFKTAKYLDQQSTTMFYPQMVSAFSDLSTGLLKDGHPDLALNALHKYEEVMPDINPNFMAAQGKITMADTSYKLDYAKLGNKLIKSVNGYLTDKLDYNYHQLQKDTGRLSPRDVQISMSLLNNMVAITHNSNQKELSGQLLAQLNDYADKFKSILQL